MATRGKRLIFCDLTDNSKAIESNAGAADILPGHLVEITATGLTRSNDADTVQSATFIADYNYLAAGDVDDAWPNGEAVVFRQLRTDERANVRVAASQNITLRGTPMAANGDGTFKIAQTGDVVRCYADEEINVSTAGTLVRVRGA